MMILGLIGCFFPIIPGPLTGWFGFVFLYQIEHVKSNKTLLLITFVIALLIFLVDMVWNMNFPCLQQQLMQIL